MRGFDDHDDSSQLQQSHDEWLEYVRNEIPVAEQAYELAIGRTELFRSFYRIRQLEFPSPFAEELERIDKLHDPERTAALEALNDAIFRSLTKHLFECARPTNAENDVQEPVSPQAQIDQLLSHLAQRNPYFARWIEYKKGVADHEIVEKWDEYLLQTTRRREHRRSRVCSRDGRTGQASRHFPWQESGPSQPWV